MQNKSKTTLEDNRLQVKAAVSVRGVHILCVLQGSVQLGRLLFPWHFLDKTV